MKTGNLPSRDGSETDVGYNHDANKITVEINGQREELSLIEGVRFANRIMSMIEVVMSNG